MVETCPGTTASRHSFSVTHEVGNSVPAAHIALAGAALEAGDSAWEARAATAILDLVLKLSQAGSLRAALRSLVNEAHTHLGCEHVAVGLRRGRRGRCPLASVSGVADHGGCSETLGLLEAALDEAVLRESLTVWPPPNDDSRDLPAAHRDLAAHFGSGGVLSAPLRAADGSVAGAWTLLGSKEFAHGRQNQRFLEAASHAVGASLAVVKRAQGGPIRRACRQGAQALPWLRAKLLAVVAAVLVAAMFVPVPHYVPVECDLQPVVRRYVAAPHAGEFQKSLVKPGDLVARDQLLGRMDGREIRWELAGLAAEQERARKSRDVNMAAGKTAAAQIDRLEAERQQVKRKLMEDRLARLEVRSPVDGIVVSGDLQRSEGVPVSVGQVLYEVAPLDRLMVELAIADEAIAHVEATMPATLRFDAHPGSSWSGQIARIHPRSVTREKDNVFVGEVALDNSGGELRPGMKGHARIRAADRSLGWVLFHKPWNFLRSWLDI